MLEEFNLAVMSAGTNESWGAIKLSTRDFTDYEETLIRRRRHRWTDEGFRALDNRPQADALDPVHRLQPVFDNCNALVVTLRDVKSVWELLERKLPHDEVSIGACHDAARDNCDVCERYKRTAIARLMKQCPHAGRLPKKLPPTSLHAAFRWVDPRLGELLEIRCQRQSSASSS